MKHIQLVIKPTFDEYYVCGEISEFGAGSPDDRHWKCDQLEGLFNFLDYKLL